jgi:hypothetical protein
MFLEEVKLYWFFLQHAMCIASFILHWKLCRVRHDHTGTTSWMQLHTLLGMQAEDIALHSYAFEVLLEEISLLLLLKVCSLYIVLLMVCYRSAVLY